MLDPPFIHVLFMLSYDLDMYSKDSDGDFLLMMVAARGKAESVSCLQQERMLVSFFLHC